MTMFFFDKEPVWRQYIKELRIQRAVDNLKSKGLHCEWPMHVPDPDDPATLKATVTAGCYKSPCPYYEGMWLCGGTSAVECTAAGEWIPGIVWYEVCEHRHTDCPFYKNKEGVDQ